MRPLKMYRDIKVCLKKYRLNSILSRLFISYIIIIILIIGAGSSTYKYTKSILMARQIEHNEVNLEYIQEIIDGQINTIYKAGFSFFQDQHNIKSLKNIDSIYEQSYMIDKLNTFTLQYSLIDTAILYNSKLNNILFDQGSLSNNYAFSEYFKYDQVKDILSLITQDKNKFGYIATMPVIVDAKKNQVEKYFTMYFSTSYQQDNILILLLKENDIASMFDKFEKESYFMVIDPDGNILVDAKKDISTENLTEIIYDSIAQDKKSIIQDEQLIVFEKSKLFDWYYICVTPIKYIIKDTQLIRNIFIIASIGISIFCLLIAIYSINRNYRPIRKILNYFKEDENQCKDEFEQIFKSIEKLSIENNHQKEQEILYNFIQNGRYNSVLSKTFGNDYLISLYVVSKSPHLLSKWKSELQNLYNNVKLIKMGMNELYCIINARELEYTEVINNINKIKENELGSIVIGISNLGKGAEQLKRVCSESYDAVMQGKVNSTSYTYEYNNIIRSMPIYFPVEFEVNIISCIQSYNKKSINNVIKDIINNNKLLSNQYMDNIKTEFITIYIKLAQRFKIEYELEKIKIELMHEYNISYMMSYVIQMYETLVKEEVVDDKSKYVASYIKGYIEKNYKDSNITVDLIASKINLSATYVSTLFKKETGVAFTQYLSDYRIEKSKYLLEHTDKKVKDIAEEIGFGTYNNFNRVFKKKTGLIPSEYKKNMM